MCRLINEIPPIWQPCRERPLWFTMPKGVPKAWLRALTDRELALLLWSGERSVKVQDESYRRNMQWNEEGGPRMTVGELRTWLAGFDPSIDIGILLPHLERGWALHEISLLGEPTRPNATIPVMLKPGEGTYPLWPKER